MICTLHINVPWGGACPYCCEEAVQQQLVEARIALRVKTEALAVEREKAVRAASDHFVTAVVAVVGWAAVVGLVLTL